jgi:hypothetical protein
MLHESCGDIKTLTAMYWYRHWQCWYFDLITSKTSTPHYRNTFYLALLIRQAPCAESCTTIHSWRSSLIHSLLHSRVSSRLITTPAGGSCVTSRSAPRPSHALRSILGNGAVQALTAHSFCCQKVAGKITDIPRPATPPGVLSTRVELGIWFEWMFNLFPSL